MFVWIGPLIGALASALVAYLVVARKTSGKIATSEASELWAESRNIRSEYREQIEKLRIRVADLEAQNNKLTRDYHEKVDPLEQLVETLRDRIEVLEQGNKSLRAENVALKKIVEDMRNGKEPSVEEIDEVVEEIEDAK